MNRSDFLNPPNQYREVPFWSWNDELEPQELRRQVRLIKEAGWGGFFMHARIGLRTPYMSPEWMTCIEACVDEASKLGIDAWLYDEDKWPSGFAGGLSVTDTPAFRAQYLVCKIDDRPALIQERIITFAARYQDGRLVDIRQEDDPPFRDRFDRVVQFYTQSMPLGDPWFNGYAYLSLLSKDAVRAFLNSTHEVYASRVGNEFGKTIPGIFTDEPCTYFRFSRMANPELNIPWEASLPGIFRERRGYDLIPHLPSLFFDWGDNYRVRHDFWRTVTEMFVESYSRQLFEWCETHRLKLTGHYMSEDNMLTQIQWGLAAAMPHYAYMHYPGIDKLGRQINKIYGMTLTVKQLDSAACQLGKERALVENFALSGQDFAHQGRKWLADWAAVLGANFHNLHLGLYSMKGERKRDCPPNLYYQQPWWGENKSIADYTARLAYALSQGKRVVDILVIHPMGSAWALYRPGGVAKVENLDRQLDELLLILLRNQRDFHLGDEMMMEPGGDCEAKVELIEGIACLRVGKMLYRVVIVPAMVTLTGDTARILKGFSEAGGIVIAVEPLPTHMDGLWNDGNILPENCIKVKPDEMSGVLDQTLPFDVSVPGLPDIWVHHRKNEDEDIYFLANTSLEHGGQANVKIRLYGHGKNGEKTQASYRLKEWDLKSGSVYPLPAKAVDGFLEVTVDFAPAGSRLLVLQPGRGEEEKNQPAKVGERSTPKPSQGFDAKEWRVTREIELNSAWEIEPDSPNALVLDKAKLRIDDSNWSEPLGILTVQSLLSDKGIGTPFSLQFAFSIDSTPEGEVFLILEDPNTFTILVNDQQVVIDGNWWLDISFKKVNISRTLRPGLNIIELKRTISIDMELEAIYITGLFGVAARWKLQEGVHNGQVFDRYSSDVKITTIPSQLVPKEDRGSLKYNLTAQSFPFFAGRVRLCQEVIIDDDLARAWIAFDQLRAAVTRVRVNGKDCGAIAWEPHEVDVTAAIQKGSNKIEIELSNTLRNLLGPLHLSGGEKDYTGPGEYRDPNQWTDDLILVPFGFKRVQLIYCEERNTDNGE
jgi:hypothetical protein